MNPIGPIDRYVCELGTALQVRGAARRRFLRESRDHLLDAAAERGEAGAVRAFGVASEVAAAFDAEASARRAMRSTFVTVAGVLATGGSTLALIHGASSAAAAPIAWAIVFFVAAQVAGVSAGLALLQALILRRSGMSPAQLVLLTRRNACALASAGLTMFAAGAALPGRGSAALLLVGPALLCAAAVAVLRARSLARRLDGSRAPSARPPVGDLIALTGLRLAPLDAPRLLGITAGVAAVAAFARDRAEQASIDAALTTAGIEALAVIACFLVLGPVLGLWSRPARGRSLEDG